MILLMKLLLMLLWLVVVLPALLTGAAGADLCVLSWGILLGGAALQLLMLQKCRRRRLVWLPFLIAVGGAYVSLGVACHRISIPTLLELSGAMLCAAFFLYLLLGVALGALLNGIIGWIRLHKG